MSRLRETARSLDGQREKIGSDKIFFIEVGFGNDSHGQSATKAAVRACRNAIEFNSIPSIKRLIPDVSGIAIGCLMHGCLSSPLTHQYHREAMMH